MACKRYLYVILMYSIKPDRRSLESASCDAPLSMGKGNTNALVTVTPRYTRVVRPFRLNCLQPLLAGTDDSPDSRRTSTADVSGAPLERLGGRRSDCRYSAIISGASLQCCVLQLGRNGSVKLEWRTGPLRASVERALCIISGQ